MRLSIAPLMLVMAITTYLIRMLPFTLFQRKIRSRFVRSFFHYIPYAVLAAMLIPGAFFSTGALIPAIVGVFIGVLLAYFERSLLTVSIVACLVVFLVGLIPF